MNDALLDFILDFGTRATGGNRTLEGLLHDQRRL